MCDKEFKLSSDFKKHFTILHANESKFECEQCGKSFAQEGSLRRHISSIHNCERHSCDFCEKSFSEKGTLYKHMKSVHEGILNHKCELCDMSFDIASRLQSHVETIHVGMKNFQCKSCDKTYTSSSALRLHSNSMHKNATITENKCGFCEKCFVNKGNLTKHLLTCNIKT